MNQVNTRYLGRCLTERKLADFDAKLVRYGEFTLVSQYVAPEKRPTHVSQIAGPLIGEPRILDGTILFGVEEDGSLTWLGEIIDSSD